MRKSKSNEAKETKETKETTAETVKTALLKNKKTFTDRVKSMAVGAQDAWSKAQPYIDMAHPYVMMLKPVFEVFEAIVMLIWNIIHAVLPFLDEQTMQIMFAVVLLFMGGQFAMTIACVQAFKTCGWSSMKKSYEQLKESYHDTREALNNDPDARELFGAGGDDDLTVWHLVVAAKDTLLAESDSEGQKSFKRMYVVLKCVDPNKILDASVGFWVGIVAILSTLRSQMVYCVNIGASIGNNISKMLQHYVEGYVGDRCSASTKTWIMFGLRSTCGLGGIIISLLMTRIVSAFCSALQGATLLSKVLHNHLNAQKGLEKGKRSSLGNLVFNAPASPGQLVTSSQKMTTYEMGTMWVIALAGFLFQLATRFNLPMWMKVPLAPVYFVESCLAVIAIY